MTAATDRLGIEFISALGMPPAEFVGLAADLGCTRIGLALQPIAVLPGRYPAWSLRDDAALRRETLAALSDRGVSVSIGEGFMIRPSADIADAASDMDKLCELGARRMNVLSLEADPGRALDQFARFADMAGERGLEATLEFLPGLPIADLAAAARVVRAVGRPNFRLLLDSMHLFRSGGTVADVAALEPGLIAYVQLCDGPRVSRHAAYADEARYDRLPPGEGDFPLAALLAALPRDLTVGLEVPMLKRAETEGGPRAPLAACVRAARALLQGMEGPRP
jgi:sugar phosphate isomerase/epimerase